MRGKRGMGRLQQQLDAAAAVPASTDEQPMMQDAAEAAKEEEMQSSDVAVEVNKYFKLVRVSSTELELQVLLRVADTAMLWPVR